ncbi:hypothetical protein TTRE_0000928501 [Trichuris trichiura]|uniref:Uncharacterized protein n=1 Tax=Trichuris trichiura TaxID=36087 RepID=A0A077ZKK3_TRITR|nr:hypothetical protein TTRE_0000928501 [Trichuris trichiura]
MSGRKPKNAIKPSKLPSMEGILNEPEVKNSLRNVARCAARKRAARTKAAPSKRQPKKTKKSNVEYPEVVVVDHYIGPKQKPTGKRRRTRPPPIHRYNLRSRPLKDEPSCEELTFTNSKRPAEAPSLSPCSIEPVKLHSCFDR